MTSAQAKRAKEAYEDYRFKALLSVLTDEQRVQFEAYMKEHLPDLKTTLMKFLAPQDAEDIMKQLRKVGNFG